MKLSIFCFSTQKGIQIVAIWGKRHIVTTQSGYPWYCHLIQVDCVPCNLNDISDYWGQYWPMGLPSSRYHLKNAYSKIKERLNFHIRMKYLSMYARHDIKSDPDIPGPVTFLSAPVHRKNFLGSNLKESDGNCSAGKYVQRPNYAPWMYVEDILNDATDILYKIS